MPTDVLPAASAAAPPAAAPALLAAVDMGSNSFRLEVGQLRHGSYRRVDYLKETVRLGAGLDADGLLTEEAMQRGLDCLARFARRLAGFAPSQVRAVATQTLREARNRDAFLARGAQALGQPIEVVSGREEARLIFVGVARLQPSDRTRLVIDIGGRSTELILGRGRKPARAESYPVGSVGLSMRHFADGRFTEAAFRAARIAAAAQFGEALEAFSRRHWEEALGSSGTAGAVSQVLAAGGVTDGTITPEALRWCIARCLEAGRADRLSLPGLKDDRRPVIGGGLAILATLAEQFGIEALAPARGALRQGVIFDLDARHSAAHLPGADAAHATDMRDASVRQLQRRFEIDVAQAARVAAVADRLWTSVGRVPNAAVGAKSGSSGRGEARPAWDGAEWRQELAWACALHEIGMMVSHHDHHRHSAYVLAHADAAGFSQSQQRRLADLALAQRGGLRKCEAALAQDAVAWQVLCLRLAVIQCQARGAVDAGALALRRQGTQALLSFPAAWTEAEPRTLYLLDEEVAAWEKCGPLKLAVAAR